VDEKGTVTVEFYGVPRQRAGRAELVVQAETLAEALTAVELACPRLSGLMLPAGRLSPQYLLSLDGRRFTRDLKHTLRPGERVILLSADAGG
jgi:hypothetical protein